MSLTSSRTNVPGGAAPSRGARALLRQIGLDIDATLLGRPDDTEERGPALGQSQQASSVEP